MPGCCWRSCSATCAACASAWIVLADLAQLAEQPLPPILLELQVFAVEARYEEGPFALPSSREPLLDLLEVERQRCQKAVEEALNEQDPFPADPCPADHPEQPGCRAPAHNGNVPDGRRRP
jgi:hypothetical protein